MDLYLTNSLTRKKEKFEPINSPNVRMYTCGPTVYDFASIGNFRTYITADILLRVLKYNGFKVSYVMNITDVGHLTGDNFGDADIGEDRIEKAAEREGKTAWDIAKFYTDAFLTDFKKLNLTSPDNLVKATEHIQEQIELVRRLEEKGFAYRISDGVYFDTKEYEKKTGKKYGELSTMDAIKEGARVEPNPEKKNPRDFALWKLSYPGGRSFDSAQDGSAPPRQMEWESPWGVGFPGWHIECSAMSMKYLGDSFDIHAGGEDLRQTHHPNEIAQSEGATGKTFVKYWVHTTHLKVEGKRMGRSLGNIYTISDLEEKGYEPLALRYLYLTAHYRDSLNFTWDSIDSAQKALENLRAQVYAAKSQKHRTALSEEKRKKIDDLNSRFQSAVNDDLNTPQALAVLWEAMKGNIPSEDKYDLAISFDEIFGLKLREYEPSATKEVKTPKGNKIITTVVLSGPTIARIDARELARKSSDFEKADKIREEIRKTDKLEIKDTPDGTQIEPTK